VKIIRVFYSKSGRAAYISHLDLNRTMQRAIKRADIPIWYTEGYNPHIYLTFALPLPVGYCGLCESMDLRLLQEDYPLEELVLRLDAAMPEGLRVIKAGAPRMEPREIFWADYRIRMALVGKDSKEALDLFANFSAQDSIWAVKKSKKGEKAIDLKSLFHPTACHADEDRLSVLMRARAGEQLNVSPSLIVQSFCEMSGATLHRFEAIRIGTYTENEADFQ
jgi:radical SAM-linked protein